MNLFLALSITCNVLMAALLWSGNFCGSCRNRIVLVVQIIAGLLSLLAMALFFLYAYAKILDFDLHLIQ